MLEKSKLDLAFCAVIKDNLKNIKRMFCSIESLQFSEIVIIDTGSDSDVIQYLKKKIGSGLYQEKWINDFAKYRNFAISKTKSRWIFTLDSDESISSGLVEAIPRLIRNTRVEGYKLPRIHYAAEKKPLEDYWRHLRLYRRKAKYIGAVHESIKNLKDIKIINNFEYAILHYNQRTNQRKKSIKYSQWLKSKIFEAQTRKDKDSLRYYQYKLWVQDNVYLLETDPKISEKLLESRYQEYEKRKKEIEDKIKRESWRIK